MPMRFAAVCGVFCHYAVVVILGELNIVATEQLANGVDNAFVPGPFAEYLVARKSIQQSTRCAATDSAKIVRSAGIIDVCLVLDRRQRRIQRLVHRIEQMLAHIYRGHFVYHQKTVALKLLLLDLGKVGCAAVFFACVHLIYRDSKSGPFECACSELRKPVWES